MEINVSRGDIAQQQADCIVVNLFEGVTAPGGATGAVDRALDGAITNLIASGDFTGESGTTALLYTNGKLPAPRVLLVGLGKQEKFDHHSARKASAVVAKAIANIKGAKSYATIVHGAGFGGLDAQTAAQALAEGSLLALYKAPNYKRESSKTKVESCTVIEFDQSKLGAVEAGVEAGRAIASGVISARDYVSEPPNVLNPAEFARRAQAMAESVGLSCTILREADMKELGMGILLAVSRGSRNEARFKIGRAHV